MSLRLVIPGLVLAGVLLLTLLAPLLAGQDPVRMDVAHRFAHPEPGHLLGTDEFGRDIFSRLLYGGRPSLQVAFGASLLAAAVGVLLGLLGGYFSGLAELLTVRLVDVILSFPPIVLALLFVTLLGSGVATLTVVIGFLYIPSFARTAGHELISAEQMGKQFVFLLRKGAR